MDALLKNGNTTLVLVWADYCGHCHHYMPTWDSFGTMPERKANMAKVHYDMVPHVSALKGANLAGYPSVLKVNPDGSIEEYKEESGVSNAMPHMRDEEAMKKEMKMETGKQSGGYAPVVSAFVHAIQKAGPASLLLLAHGALSPKHSKTYKSPKRSSRRASSRKQRSTRKK